jgi:V-type H+-transporting ATPase subunit a
LKQNFFELTELKYTLQKAQQFFEEQDQIEVNINGIQNQMTIEETGLSAAMSGMHFGFVAGVIPRERMPPFEKMLWRACRGNVFLRRAEIDEPILDPLLGGGEIRKTVFLIFFQGDQLKIRVKKICEGFRSTLYPCPEQVINQSLPNECFKKD